MLGCLQRNFYCFSLQTFGGEVSFLGRFSLGFVLGDIFTRLFYLVLVLANPVRHVGLCGLVPVVLYRLLQLLGDWQDYGSIIIFVNKQIEADELFAELLKVSSYGSDPVQFMHNLSSCVVGRYCSTVSMLCFVHWLRTQQ